MMNEAIGIDIGGTAIKAGLVTKTGEVIEKMSIATEAASGVDHVIGRIAELIRHLEQKAGETKHPSSPAVGVGMPGNINRSEGVVMASPNFAGWKRVPLVDRLTAATDKRIVIDNDANQAAWGEYRCGAGRGEESMILLTLGTGIGSGMILDGKVWRGATGDAGEWGHAIMQVDGRRCACGQAGCLEAYASAVSTVRRATERIRQGEPSQLKAALDRADEITCEMVLRAAEEGDALAASVWRETCRYLAVACLNILHTLNPDCIVFSGGMIAAGEQLLRPVISEMEEMNSKQFGGLPKVRLATLGNHAGFVGAALSVWRHD